MWDYFSRASRGMGCKKVGSLSTNEPDRMLQAYHRLLLFVDPRRHVNSCCRRVVLVRFVE